MPPFRESAPHVQFREKSTKRASDFIARLPFRLCTPRQFEVLVSSLPEAAILASSLGAGTGSSTCEKVLQASFATTACLCRSQLPGVLSAWA